MDPRRILHIAGTAELATLALMLLNLGTVHHPVVTDVVGPLHGLVYTGTVVAAALLAAGRHRVWLLALIPGAGGLLAARGIPPRTP